MAEILGLQDDEPDTPGEEKGSWYSLAVCRNSYKSLAVCMVK